MEYSAHHKLVANDSQSEVIDGISMVLPAHHLWSHVAGSAAGILRVFSFENSGNAEIGDPNVALRIED